MKTVSILEYDPEFHQFYPSFVIHNDFLIDEYECECAFDEMCINPSEEWMNEYFQWNRFGRLPDDPSDDETAAPKFNTLKELQDFNAKGKELAERLQEELQGVKDILEVEPFKPLYSNMVVGPVAAWWHVKDGNYDIVVPLQRLPISDDLKSRFQAWRFHKDMGLWQDPEKLRTLILEGRMLEDELLLELHAKPVVQKLTRRGSRTIVTAMDSLQLKGRMGEHCSSTDSFVPCAV